MNFYTCALFLNISFMCKGFLILKNLNLIKKKYFNLKALKKIIYFKFKTKVN